MTTPGVALRFDADREIGIGHLKRCLTLASKLSDLGAVPFAIVGGQMDAIPVRRASNGLKHVMLPSDADMADEAAAVADSLPDATMLLVFDLVHGRSTLD